MSTETVVIHQAQHDPIGSLEKLGEFINAIGTLPKWSEGGVLTDKSAQNQLIVLLSETLNVSVRLNLVFGEIEAAFNKLGIADEVHVRHMQGKHLERKHLASMESVIAIWNESQAQSMDIKIKDLPDFLRAIWEKRQTKGRGKSIDTKSKVWKL